MEDIAQRVENISHRMRSKKYQNGAFIHKCIVSYFMGQLDKFKIWAISRGYKM